MILEKVVTKSRNEGSLYRRAGRQRRSERLKVGPYECPDWGYFCERRTANCGLRSLLMFRQKGFGIVADFF